MSLTSLRRTFPAKAAVAAASAVGIAGTLGIAASASAATTGGHATRAATTHSAASKSKVNPLDLFLFVAGSELLNGLNYPGGPYTVQGNMSVGSHVTVTRPGAAAAYSMTLGTSGSAASGLLTKGYVVPSGERITFPRGLAMNLAVLRNELPYADITDPTKDRKVKQIGSLKLNSPLALLAGGGMTNVDGGVYLVHARKANDLKPMMELYFGGDYVLGTINRMTFPMTVTFREPVVPQINLRGHYISFLKFGPQALPLARMDVSFPAKTSPFTVTSCKRLGALKATVTDALASYSNPLDPHLKSGESTGPIKIASTKTVVTDRCK